MLRRIRIITLFFIFQCTGCYTTNAQNNSFKANVGFGIWQGLHAGIDYRFKNFSIGFDAGSSLKIYPFGYKNHSFTLDNSLFWGRANNENLKCWYLNGRLNYWYQNTRQTLWQVLFFCPSIGREFNFNSKNGISIDIGAALALLASRKDEPKSPRVGWIYPIYPECRLEYFYRF